MPGNSKPSPDEKESGGGTASQSTEDETIKVLSIKLKTVTKANASFRGNIKASLLNVIDSINESEENERKELSKVVLSSDEGGAVETMPEGAPDEEVEAMNDTVDDGVASSSCLMDDDVSVAAVGASNRKGKSKHPNKKKSKKKKASKSKKNRTSNSTSSNTVVNNSSTNSYYWGANGGVSLKVVKRVVVVLMSIACLLSMTVGHEDMEEQHNDPSPEKNQHLQENKGQIGLVSKASRVDDGGKSSATARILQASGWPMEPEGCDDTLGWVDVGGEGCQWYETYDEPGCPLRGNLGGDMGPAKDNCCHCQRTVSPSTSSNPTSPPVDLIYEGCENTKGWVGSSGVVNCQWYETYDEPGCRYYGNEYVGDMGPAKDNCCYCILAPTTSPTVDLIYEGCDDTLDWVDEWGDDCRFYEIMDEPGCPYFHYHEGGDMGPAKDNCCHCFFATALPSTSPHPTSSPPPSSPPTSSSNPTYSPTTSHPSSSPSTSHPTNSPTTTTGSPTLSPTASPRPTSLPSTTSHPTSSSFPTDLPSLSSNPTSSSKPSNSPTTTLEQKCPVADKTTCGCDVVSKSDYRGTMNVTADGVACVRWNIWGVYYEQFINAGLEDNNFCRNPDNRPEGPFCLTPSPSDCNIPACDPCGCMPLCGQPLNEACPCHHVMLSQECCKENESDCKCNYLKDACRISLQNNSSEFCEEAEAACCKSMGGSSNSDCECLMYEDICTRFPGKFTCEAAVGNCCSDSHCKCDFYEYTSSALNYNSEVKEEACQIASNHYRDTFAEEETWEKEKWALEHIYYLAGEYWIDNTNWLDDTVPHCYWYGITCNGGYVTEINLNSNNLEGNVDSELWYQLSRFSQLAKLDLSNNNLRGRLDSQSIDHRFSFYSLKNLGHIDISGNNLNGHAPMWFSVTTSYVNVSHNSITSISFRRSIPSYESLEVLDVSNNNITQDVSSVLRSIPPNLVQLDLSHNSIEGALVNPFPNLHRLQELSIATNRINGAVPDLSRATPSIKMLDLSNQQLEMNGGLIGTIQPALSQLEDLTELYLAGNKLSGSIPTQFGNFLQLKVLDLSSNALVTSIPVELGRLDETLDVLDVSHNYLTGVIPLVLGGFPSHFMVHLNGNSNLSDAPLSLCSTGRTDLENGTVLCPTERNALKAIYLSAKGSEWTKSDGWLAETGGHCEWHGVTCDETNSHVTELKLKSNGLSGTLSNSIEELSSLAVLDLRDNDIKGYVPTEIGSLSKLTHLQLSYNTFRGSLPSSFSNLISLQIIHLHANRFAGVVPLLDSSLFDDKSSFIADCGYPSLYEDTLTCKNCTMCCNSQDECTPKDEVERFTYMELAGIFLACIFGFSVALALAVVVFDKKFVTRVKEWVANWEVQLGNNPTLSPSSQERPTLRSSLAHALQRRPSMDLYAKNAVARMGGDSTYCFLLGNSWCGWAIAVATIAFQLWLLFTFVQASKITDWTNDRYDVVYSWKCSWDDDECDDKSDLDGQGWAAFGILIGVHALKDIINGIRMIVLSALSTMSDTFTMSEMRTRIRYFIGGWLLVTITSFTVFASAVYNKATAASNTEIIINSVVIIFMLEIDELLHRSLKAMSEDWVRSMSTNTKGDEQRLAPSGSKVEVKEDSEEGQNVVVQHSTFSEQLGGQSASPISNSAGAEERTVEQDSDSNNAGVKDDVEANMIGGARLAQGNGVFPVKSLMDQMQDQINDIKKKGDETLASLEEQNKLLREQNAALQRQLTAPQDSNDANDDVDCSSSDEEEAHFLFGSSAQSMKVHSPVLKCE